MKWFTMVCVAMLCTPPLQAAEKSIEVDISLDKRVQTIHSFGASDCWRTQYIGLWSDAKREAIADLLFSDKFDKDGNPEGIALTLWRFNIGSGSHDVEGGAGVASAWRRTECFLDKDGNWDWSKQEGQRWMMEAARKRGVKYTLGFSISAPYYMSINGLTRASDKSRFANLKEECYDDYAYFLAEVCNKLKLDYLSPINEPQWEWVGTNQEGMQATNEECSRLIGEIGGRLKKTQIVFGEAGDIRYLYRKGTNKPERDNQIEEMFSKDGKHSITEVQNVAPIISGHSYWSTFPLDTMIITRQELRGALPKGYSYWQAEYCPMESNDDNPNGGGGRDEGINTALYIARVMHYDLTQADATSWQSWTAFSEWDYKDGLIFIDDGKQRTGARRQSDPLVESCKTDGEFHASKALWALGNYSRFVRPGMVRVESQIEGVSLEDQAYSLMASAYRGKRGEVVVVLINYSDSPISTELNFDDSKEREFDIYETSERRNLEYCGTSDNSITVPARSLITLKSR
ncbi:MAG: glycoside hydrolase [Rikenellaceae bacterium]